MRALITGGAGFIGSFLADDLLKRGHEVTIFDNLEGQVHRGKEPDYLNRDARFVRGDVRSRETLSGVLRETEIVYHLASRVGVGQSNYEIASYVEANVVGTANILDVIVTERAPVQKIVMTASMTSYGEGDYSCDKDGIVRRGLRTQAEIKTLGWEPRCPHCGGNLRPIPTPERQLLDSNSVYAFTKNAQEELIMRVGGLYGIPTVSFRCFNVYGSRQSLSNPYTGVAAIFISRIRAGQPPVVYEDGLQTRDFISVHDVVRALGDVAHSGAADGMVLNMGSGTATTIADLARKIAVLLDSTLEPIITQTFRKNDIRHCIADNSRARSVLRWSPNHDFDDGLRELIVWSADQASEDSFEAARAQLRARGLE